MKNIETKKTTVKCLPYHKGKKDNIYEYSIAIDSELLYVLDVEATKIVDIIIDADQKEAYLAIFECQDDMLDFILECLECHRQGISLLTLIDVNDFM